MLTFHSIEKGTLIVNEVTIALECLLVQKVLLRYKSYIIHLASTFLYLVPLTLGLMEQKQIIPVELYESYYDSYVSVCI